MIINIICTYYWQHFLVYTIPLRPSYSKATVSVYVDVLRCVCLSRGVWVAYETKLVCVKIYE